MVAVLVPCLGAEQSHGQSLQKELGAGFLVGPFSGVTVKARLSNRDELPRIGPKQSVDLNFSSNFDNYARWSAHVLNEQILSNSPLTAYLGPGLTAGIDEKELFWGLSSEIGVLFQKGPYEIFLQGMPRLFMLPEFDGRIEAATGIRIFF